MSDIIQNNWKWVTVSRNLLSFFLAGSASRLTPWLPQVTHTHTTTYQYCILKDAPTPSMSRQIPKYMDMHSFSFFFCLFIYFWPFMALLIEQLKIWQEERERGSDTQQRDPGRELNPGPLQSLGTWDARSTHWAKWRPKFFILCVRYGQNYILKRTLATNCKETTLLTYWKYASICTVLQRCLQ